MKALIIIAFFNTIFLFSAILIDAVDDDGRLL